MVLPFKYQPEYKEYYRMDHSILPPRQSYRLILKENIIKASSDKASERLIYYGGKQLYPEELASLASFQPFLVSLSPESQQIAKKFNTLETLRFLAASKFKNQDAFNEMVTYEKWKADNYPILLNDELNSKLITICGRDIYFRPIFFLDLVVLTKLHKEGHKLEDMNRVGTFILEHIIHYMMLPGQIENWVIVIDIQKQGLLDMPINAMLSFLKIFQNVYKSKCGKIFVINTTFFTLALWKVASIFLDDTTKAKITMSGDPLPPDMKEIIHPSQLSQKYGGWAVEPKSCWPPTITSKDFILNDQSVYKEEDYKKVLTNSYIIPSPELASAYKDSRKSQGIPNKIMYFNDKIVTMDEFNNVVSVKDY